MSISLKLQGFGFMRNWLSKRGVTLASRPAEHLPSFGRLSRRIWIFKPQQVSRFVQFHRRITQVVPRHLVTRFIHHTLEAGAGILQATLQSTWPHVQSLRDGTDGRSLTRQLVLNRPPHQFDEAVFLLLRIVRKGDVIKSAPGVEHWHGAPPTSGFAYIAVTPTALGTSRRRRGEVQLVPA